jgi:hypothetical protein
VLDGVGAVQQRRAAQALADVTGFGDGKGSGLGIGIGIGIGMAHKVTGLVEQAVSEVIGPA